MKKTIIKKNTETGVIEVNRDMVIEYVDPALKYYFKQPELLVGIKITSVPEFKNCNLATHINKIASGQSIQQRITLNVCNTKKQILIEGEPLMDRSGAFKHAIVLLHDVSTLMKKWDVFNVSLTSYKNITNTIPSGIIVADTNGWIRFINPVARKMLDEGSRQKRKVPATLKIPAGTTREIYYTSPGKDRFFLKVAVTEAEWFGKSALLYVLHDVTLLRKSENQNILLLTAIQSAANAMAIVRDDFSLEWANPAFTKLTGRSLNEAVDRKIYHLMNIDESLAKSFIGSIEDLVSGTEVFKTEISCLRKDGTYFDCELTITSFSDNIAGDKRYVFVFDDLTQRKEKEKIIAILNKVFRSLEKASSLEESFVIFRDELAKNNLHSVIYFLDEKKKVLVPRYFSFETKMLEQYTNMAGAKFDSLNIPVSMSEKYRKILYERKTVFSDDVNGDLLRILPSLPPEPVRNYIRTFGLQHSISAPIINQEQKVFAVFQLLSDKLTEGNVPEVIAFANHLSFFFQKIRLLEELRKNYNKLKKSYHKLQSREAQYKEFFDNDLTGDYISTPEGKFLDCNQAFVDILGFNSKEEVLAFNPLDLYPNPEAREKILKHLQKEKRFINYEEELIRKDGRKIYVLVNSFGLFDEQGKLERNIGYIFDITRRKQYEAELIRAKEKAEESDRLKTAFLTNMSHEIRTPINAIVGFSTLLGEKNLNPGDHDEYIRIINTSVQQLLSLLDDIISMAKIEAGIVQIKYQLLDINKLLYDVHQSFFADNRLKVKKISFILDIDHKQEKMIMGNPVRIKEIFANLIGNAIKFTHTGCIHFGYAQASEDILTFYVKDSGIGIPDDLKESIFERFRQADNRLTREYEGSGLGLAICKSYVEMMGGKIWVVSTPGSGSTFYFTLPVNPAKKIKNKINS
ncbi:MAG: PAS domain-containing protein [Chlorobi bacterium]|nr:PAS domain-containing protein [Chlorobiota bacterium]